MKGFMQFNIGLVMLALAICFFIGIFEYFAPNGVKIGGTKTEVRELHRQGQPPGYYRMGAAPCDIVD